MTQQTEIEEMSSSYRRLFNQFANKEPLNTYLRHFPIVSKDKGDFKPLKTEIEEEEMHMISLRLKRRHPD
jgi:hypothetical protein